MMAISVDLIIISSLKVTAVSPSLVAVSIDESEPVSDDKVKLKSW